VEGAINQPNQVLSFQLSLTFGGPKTATTFFTCLKIHFGLDKLINNNDDIKLKEFLRTSECYFIIMVTLFAFFFSKI